ncbi:MAG: hypothetical protein ABI859_03390 [Pseudomonadota bacterium]
MLSAMPYVALRHRLFMTSRPLAVLVALCLLIAPMLSMAMDLHGLSHEAQGTVQADHYEPAHHHGVDHDDDAPGGLHALLHVHLCGHGMGIPPSLSLPELLSSPVPSVLQPAMLVLSAEPNLLFRPPRQD